MGLGLIIKWAGVVKFFDPTLSVFFKLIHYFPVLEIKFIKIVIVLLKMLMGAKLFIGPLGAGRGTLHLNFFLMRLHLNLT